MLIYNASISANFLFPLFVYSWPSLKSHCEQYLNLLIPKIEKWLPIIMPFLLVFYRTIADLTVVFVGVIFIFISYQKKDWRWLNNSWVKFNMLFWLYLLLLNSPLSATPLNSFLYGLFFVRWPLFACALAYWLFKDESRKTQFIYALCAVCAFIIFDSIWQYFAGTDLFGYDKLPGNRLSGPFKAPIPGITLLRIFFIALFALLIRRYFKSITASFWMLISLMFIGVLFMMMTGERMAFMLFLLACTCIIVGFSIEQKIKKINILAGVAAILISAIALILFSPATAERSIYSIAAKVGHFWQSDYGLVFSAAIEVWKENPIFGNGLHSYRQACEQMGLLASWGMPCSHPHNLYLQIAAETGIIGLILFMAAIVHIYIAALKQLFITKQWTVFALSFSVLTVCFLPVIGGISLLNNGVAALVWLGVGWTLSLGNSTELFSNGLSQKTLH